jgi:hypothetical protein
LHFVIVELLAARLELIVERYMSKNKVNTLAKSHHKMRPTTRIRANRDGRSGVPVRRLVASSTRACASLDAAVAAFIIRRIDCRVKRV